MIGLALVYFQNYSFLTGYERDAETGLDYAEARYYSSSQGRFTGVDPMQASAHAGNPQTWNRYSYVGNNPLCRIDPSGMIAVDDPADDSSPAARRAQQQRQRQQSGLLPPPEPCHPVSTTGQFSTLLTGDNCPAPGLVGHVDIYEPDTVESSTVILGSTLTLRSLAPVLAEGGEAAGGAAGASNPAGWVALAALVAIPSVGDLINNPRQAQYYMPDGSISCTAGTQAYPVPLIPKQPDFNDDCYKAYYKETAWCGSAYTDDHTYDACMDNAWKNLIRCLNGIPPKPFIPAK